MEITQLERQNLVIIILILNLTDLVPTDLHVVEQAGNPHKCYKFRM